MLVARITDKVLWKKCGIYHIVEGSDRWYEDGFPVARIRDKTTCKYPRSKIIQGSHKFHLEGKRVARIKDKVICPGCGLGKIIEGSSTFYEGG